MTTIEAILCERIWLRRCQSFSNIYILILFLIIIYHYYVIYRCIKFEAKMERRKENRFPLRNIIFFLEKRDSVDLREFIHFKLFFPSFLQIVVVCKHIQEQESTVCSMFVSRSCKQTKNTPVNFVELCKKEKICIAER